MASKMKSPAEGVASLAGHENPKGVGKRHFGKQDSETKVGFQPIHLASTAGSCRASENDAGLQLALALLYARVGWPVFPVGPDKRPLTPHGHKDASTDVARIIAWWTRHQDALVAIPTGKRTGLWVLDIDPPAGLASLRDLLAQFGLEDIADLSPVIVETPSGGLHIWFVMRPSDVPRTRAGDIGPGFDSRGEGGYCIAPGNVRPDGRGYRHVGVRHDLTDAAPAPCELVYMATFSARERIMIADDAALSRDIRTAEPSAWHGIVERHRLRQRERIMARLASCRPDADAMRRQALDDLAGAVATYAALADGRRNCLFTAACRLARYVAHDVLSEAEVSAALESAAAVNGAAAKHGRAWIAATIRRGLSYGANDPLPPLARAFREGST